LYQAASGAWVFDAGTFNWPLALGHHGFQDARCIGPRRICCDGCGLMSCVLTRSKLRSVAINCPNAGELAAFYAEITGGTITSCARSGPP